MIKKYICIHGHFYQPPRENAWLNEIQSQPSAAPFTNWNERICYECYAPNSAARILDSNQKILKIVNNYEKISFNIGPTLMSWLEEHQSSVYKEIIEADKVSVKANKGHGNAIAQIYNHLIMPLANDLEKEIQVHWGIKDFEFRYGRKPEGMWLSETAVNTSTLQYLSEAGILFTILAPRQIESIRNPSGEWIPFDESSIDTHHSYKVILPNGQSIAVFFYNGAISQKVAFEGLLNDGARFAEELINDAHKMSKSGIVNIATDGESYGHHHRFGEMALASCIYNIEKDENISMINYGHFLELFPPEMEIKIKENTSWSCYHGVERWRADCGCNTGGHPDWNQKYRKPLRDALDWLREQLSTLFYGKTDVLKNPHAALLDYIGIILDRNDSNVRYFLNKHVVESHLEENCIDALKLLEMMHHAQLMYTSCGWFFDELSGLESTQILQYARRAITHGEYFGLHLENIFQNMLEQCPSNKKEYANGRDIYQKLVLPEEIRLQQVAMHISVLSIFERIPKKVTLYKFSADHIVFKREIVGENQLIIGHTIMTSLLTHAYFEYSFCVMYMGGIDIIGYLKPGTMTSDYETIINKIRGSFKSEEFESCKSILRKHFGLDCFGFSHLFNDEKINLLNIISKRNIKKAVSGFRNFYNSNYDILHEMESIGFPISKGYLEIAEFVINADLIDELSEREGLNMEKIEKLSADLKKWNVNLEDPERLAFLAEKQLFDKIRQYRQKKKDPIQLQLIIRLLEWVLQLNLPINLWQSQNEFYKLLKENTLQDNTTLQQIGKQMQFS